MKSINFLCLFSALMMATPSQSSALEKVSSDNEQSIRYHAPALTYDHIKDIPSDLKIDCPLILNKRTWIFSWACAQRPPITSLWSPEDHNFVVKLLEDEGLNNSVCCRLRFATYAVYAQKKSDLELINTLFYTFFLKVPISL